MRLMRPDRVVTATQLTTRYVYTHDSPVHVGDPGLIGADLRSDRFCIP